MSDAFSPENLKTAYADVFSKALGDLSGTNDPAVQAYIAGTNEQQQLTADIQREILNRMGRGNPTPGVPLTPEQEQTLSHIMMALRSQPIFISPTAAFVQKIVAAVQKSISDVIAKYEKALTNGSTNGSSPPAGNPP